MICFCLSACSSAASHQLDSHVLKADFTWFIQTSEFTFARGALSTFDRDFMGGDSKFAKVTNWFAATLSHSFCEVHVVHHICSKIPHYHAYEAKKHVDALLKSHGINLQGNPVTWAEGIRVATECKVRRQTSRSEVELTRLTVSLSVHRRRGRSQIL